jgi:hypothetical protein
MTADEVNGIDPLDERDSEHEHRMAVLDRIADYGPAERTTPSCRTTATAGADTPTAA